jgi:adenylate cyclase
VGVDQAGHHDAVAHVLDRGPRGLRAVLEDGLDASLADLDGRRPYPSRQDDAPALQDEIHVATVAQLGYDRPLMRFRLPTVRAKLTALVSLSVVVMLAALPVLSWLLHRQLVDEVDDRVTDAERAFQTELDDDLSDLTLASRILSADGATARAITGRNADRAQQLAHVFVDVYPNIDVLLVQDDGKVLAQVGCDHPPSDVLAVPEMAAVVKGTELKGVVEHGCESPTSSAPAAYTIGVPLPGVGAVFTCMPVDAEYLRNAANKLGLELALAVLGDDQKIVGETQEFPNGAVSVAGRADTTIVDTTARSWAVQRFEPRQLHGRLGNVSMVAALDVTDIHTIVRRNLLYALGILGVAAVISVAFGSSLAGVMSKALLSVNTAVKRVEQADYVHCEAVRTGDGLKERDKLRTTFGKYMTASVMEHLMAGKVALGGESLEVTILFTDIRSFTTLSEKMDPQQLVGLLNEYFTEMVGIVMQEDGVVDKYIGDAIMAVFGAPVPKPQDAVNAVRAAVHMRTALRHLNQRLGERGLQPLRTGIGIHTGPVVAGNIGSEKRMEYTVIGDAVNLASRLESNTKELGVNVLISEDTYARVKDHIQARPVKEITVKGRKQPVMTYEVLGLTGEAPLDASESAKMASARPPAPAT